MSTHPAGIEPGITSELIDLAAVPLTALRALDNAELRRSLRHVVEQAEHPRMTAGSSSPGSIG